MCYKQKQFLAGSCPIRSLHLGDYGETLENILRLQANGIKPLIIIADIQALTEKIDASNIEGHILDLVIDYISIGVDAKESIIFVQSKIPELAELFMYLSTIVSLSKVEGIQSINKGINSGKLKNEVSLGRLSSPLSQATDILLFFTNVVLIGKSQLPRVELAREIAQKFNYYFGNVFPLPEPLVSRFPRILGLDDNQKISKSNVIFFSDSPGVVYKKIRSAITDSGGKVAFDVENKPHISNLMKIYHLVTRKTYSEIEREYHGKGYKKFKDDLAEAVNIFLEPIRERRRVLEGNMSYAKKNLREGVQKAQEEARKNMKIIKEALRMNYNEIF